MKLQSALCLRHKSSPLPMILPKGGFGSHHKLWFAGKRQEDVAWWCARVVVSLVKQVLCSLSQITQRTRRLLFNCPVRLQHGECHGSKKDCKSLEMISVGHFAWSWHSLAAVASHTSRCKGWASQKPAQDVSAAHASHRYPTHCCRAAQVGTSCDRANELPLSWKHS